MGTAGAVDGRHPSSEKILGDVATGSFLGARKVCRVKYLGFEFDSSPQNLSVFNYVALDSITNYKMV